MDKHTPPITPGCTVLLAGFGDIPEHSFLVEEVFDDLITGIALTGPFAGGIRRTRHCVGSAGADTTNLAPQQNRARQGRA